MDQIYNDWRIITETDFVTLFIKTWFAYISTLRNMFPEDRNRQGDKKYLKSYKKLYNSTLYKEITINDIIMKEIEIIYREGRKIILKNYPEYYFEDFYKLNNDLKYEYKNISADEKDGIVISVKHKEEYIFSYCFTFWGEVKKRKYNKTFKGEVDLKGIIKNQEKKLNIDSSEIEYISDIFKEFQTEIFNQISTKFDELINKKDNTKTLTSKYNQLKMETTRSINILIGLNTKFTHIKTFDEIIKNKNEYCILEQNPINYFLYYRDGVDLIPNREMESIEKQKFESIEYEMKKQSIEWFLDFVYSLRNALFHEIIDPFNEEWQKIFKNSYLILKDLVDINIKYLSEKEKVSE